MSLVETYHAEHKARMARLSPKPRIAPPAALPVANHVAKPAPVIAEKSYYPQMWFWELVNFTPRVSRTAVTSHQVGPRVDFIQSVIAKKYGISKTDILSQRRHKTVVEARHVAIYIAKTMTTQSMPEIGRRFSNRDHTTILHAVRKIAALVARDPILAARIEDIKAELLS